ncbi:hypothetical protein GOP47_0014551 [Adiantum capillus-veneris]|uniref:NF-X1-type domain-containing protein n=1 Tax=Adiantum capillus-veneris TaxID=13818 RepID=A0A9D4ZC96_ADICA|nr:hypothetical protein GOP47_0014551 [Adiantum capillus-veneris]
MNLPRSGAAPWQQPSVRGACVSSTLSKESFPGLPNGVPSSEDDEDNSGNEEDDHGLIQVDSLESSIFRGYEEADHSHHGPADISSQHALAKIRDLLVASKLKAISCLICLEKVRNSDPIWHCTAGCHAIYHLICIQAWAGEACKAAEDRARVRLSREHFPVAEHEVVDMNASSCATRVHALLVPSLLRCFASVDHLPMFAVVVISTSLVERIAARSLLVGFILARRFAMQETASLVRRVGHTNVDVVGQRKFVRVLNLILAAMSRVERQCNVRNIGARKFAIKGLAESVNSKRCHMGDCKTICRIVTLKVCRCGSLRKEAPCYQDLQCDRKCQFLRDCKRHPCKRRCCNGDCPPCSEVCGRKLRCGNHKCPAPCHRGPCAPCPVSIRISCACGSTAYEVPCGAERDKRPPRCSKQCSIIPRCLHNEICKPHRCHYGACPPCLLICNKELSCGHTCKERCHGPRPPPNPEFKLKQTKKRKEPNRDMEILGSPCPPCTERILRQCLGYHLGEERNVVCSESGPFSCGKLCGNYLACSNHICQRPCHEVTITRKAGFKAEVSDTFTDVDSCEECTRNCQKTRIPACPHPCLQRCHVGACSPCNTPLKRACHCSTLVLTFACSIYNSFGQEELAKKLSCGGPCHRKLPNCTHLCSEICHSGPCKMSTNCRKKVSVWCKCQRLKKEWFCSDVQKASAKSRLPHLRGPIGVGLLSCDEECLKLAEEQKARDEMEGLRQRTAQVIEDPPKKVGKRRRHYASDVYVKHSKMREISTRILKWCMLVLVIILVAAGIYFGKRGLYALSDWMNEREARRPQRKLSARH